MSGQNFFVNLQNRIFRPIETLLQFSLKYDDVYPVWIIGAPRSGTTLTYQLLCKSVNASYLTNKVAKRYRIALLTRIIERNLSSKSISPKSFTSNFGITKSSTDPHEGGQFFYQYFPYKNPYVDQESLSTAQKKSLKHIVNAITYPKNVFVSKNTVHSLRIKSLIDIFPNSSFIWVKRNKLDLTYSIAKSYEKNGIRKNEWWGVKVPGWEDNKFSSVEKKAIFQITQVEKIIEADLKSTNATYCTISYKELCKNPRKVITEVCKKLMLQNDQKIISDEIPASFDYSSAPKNELSLKIENLITKAEI